MNLTYEISNNMLGNPVGADLSGKVHDRDMGTDIKCILAFNERVSAPHAFFLIS